MRLLWLIVSLSLTSEAKSLKDLTKAAYQGPDWSTRLEELWAKSVRENIETGAAFGMTGPDQGQWIPQDQITRKAGLFAAKVHWSQFPEKESLRRVVHVHTHPPRTWREFQKDRHINYPSGSYDNKRVADPPSEDDILIDFSDYLKTPADIRSQIRYTGVAMGIGGAWVWEKDEAAKKLTPAEIWKFSEARNKAVLKFVEFSARFDGQTDKIMTDPAGDLLYRDLVLSYQALGVKLRFVKKDQLKSIVETPAALDSPTAAEVVR